MKSTKSKIEEVKVAITSKLAIRLLAVLLIVFTCVLLESVLTADISGTAKDITYGKTHSQPLVIKDGLDIFYSGPDRFVFLDGKLAELIEVDGKLTGQYADSTTAVLFALNKTDVFMGLNFWVTLIILVSSAMLLTYVIAADMKRDSLKSLIEYRNKLLELEFEENLKAQK